MQAHKPEAVALTKENIYSEILKASEALDNAEAPEAGRVLLVTPAVYALMKKSPDIVMDTDFLRRAALKGCDCTAGRCADCKGACKETA